MGEHSAEKDAPVRVCCGQRHYGVECPDRMVMCCVCFERFGKADLMTQNGITYDVCKRCGPRVTWEATRITPPEVPVCEYDGREHCPYGTPDCDCPGRVASPGACGVSPVEHGYGATTDCLCGRNFTKVRGLREHITKARAAEHHPNCYQITGGIPADLPSDLCDCRVLRMIDAATTVIPPEVDAS